jgi:hypothetical protein
VVISNQKSIRDKGAIKVRKVVYSMLVSLDGFIEGPNRELDWHVIDEEFHTFVNEQGIAAAAFAVNNVQREYLSYRFWTGERRAGE